MKTYNRNNTVTQHKEYNKRYDKVRFNNIASKRLAKITNASPKYVYDVKFKIIDVLAASLITWCFADIPIETKVATMIFYIILGFDVNKEE